MRVNKYTNKDKADYNHYSLYLKEKFNHQKVYKISIDAGFTCPNRDGSKGWGGCHYCNVDSFTPPGIKKIPSISEQIKNQMIKLKRLYKAQKFIAYFQPNTNTYAHVDTLKKYYDEALNTLGDLGVGLSIGTRIDCLDEEKIQLIDNYSNRYEVNLEIGLESIHSKTLSSINRGHDIDDFKKGMKLLYNQSFNVCVHTIFGLPGETQEMQLAVADFVNKLNIKFIKLHQLHIVKNSIFEKKYKKERFHLFSLEEYTSFLSKFIPRLKSSIIIERTFATSYHDELIAPHWGKSKSQIQYYIEEYLKKNNVIQGSLIP